MMNDLFDKFADALKDSKTILIIQAENPDGDSLASSLALEDIVHNLDKEPLMFCPVQVPRYLRYIKGWDRVSGEFPNNFDMVIIVDASASILMERVLTRTNVEKLSDKPVFIIDHHDVKEDLPFKTTVINDEKAVSTGELIFDIAQYLKWPLNQNSAELLTQSIMSDSLGLTTPNTTVKSVETIVELMKLGANISKLDNRRREMSKKSREIFDYKGELFKRVEFLLSGELAIIVIPWDEIKKYSDQYNPSMLIIDEARMVEGVKVVVALKTYPDGKITAKIRSNHGYELADKIAGQFGGGGHKYASGFKVRDMALEEVRRELVETTSKLLEQK